MTATLGIRLSQDEQAMLARHAYDKQTPKSVLARDWIRERLERESVEAQLRDAAVLLA